MRRVIKDVLVPIAVAIALAFVIQASVAKPYEIPTASMVPTIQVNDRIIANRLVYRFRDVDRGDIIVFDPPPAAGRACPGAGTGIPFVKRVIGLPGDTVVVGGGRTIVNGRPFVVEDAEVPRYARETFRVPAGELFVLGDNRNESCDSHEWGFVPLDNVIGQAEVTYWPPTHVTFLD